MDSPEIINRIFEDSTTYELLGRIHWRINAADSLNDKLCLSQTNKNIGGFRPAEEITTNHGKRYCGQEISWWINQKENNHAELLVKTTQILPFCDKTYNDFKIYKSIIPKNYNELLEPIKKFNDDHVTHFANPSQQSRLFILL